MRFTKGHTPWNKGKSCTEEIKRKIGLSSKGRKHSEETKRKISEGNKGKIVTEETKRKISIAVKGKTIGRSQTEEVKKKIGAAMMGNTHAKGHKRDEAFRRKISEFQKGRPKSQETKEKLRQAILGKKRPDMVGKNNPMFTHPNAYKSKFGKCGFRTDLGIFVRSTWEANMMRIFKHLNLSIEYEPKSFMLSNGKSYTPDFYIHETKEFVEVKGRWIDEAKEKVELFLKEYPNLSLVIVDAPVYKQFIKDFSTSNLILEGI